MCSQNKRRGIEMELETKSFDKLIDHALQLMRSENNTRYSAQIENLLVQCLTAYPADADLPIWLGLAVEVQGDSERAHALYRQALERYESNADTHPEAQLNKAVALYRMKDAKALNDCLPHIPSLDSQRHDLWLTYGYLYVFLGRFQEALICANTALESASADLHARLLKGLSLEGLQQYNAAAQLLEAMLSETLPFEIELEVNHILAHVLTERRQEGDIPRADAYMRRAVELDSDYVICLGVIHSETRRYNQAVAIFDEALSNSRILMQPALYVELRFYRGEAYWGLQEYEKARDDFEVYEKYHLEHRNIDNVVFSRCHLVKLHLKSTRLSELAASSIAGLERVLAEYEPSLFASTTLHTEWHRLRSILHVYASMRDILDASDVDAHRLTRLLNALEEIYDSDCGSPPAQCANLTILGDDLTIPSCISSLVRVQQVFESEGGQMFELVGVDDKKSLSFQELTDLLNNEDIWIIDTRHSVRLYQSHILGIFGHASQQTTKSIIAVASPSSSSSYLLEGTVRVDSLTDAILLTQVVLLYEGIKRELVDVLPEPGFVYYDRVPSLSTAPQNPLPSRLRKALTTGRWLDD